MLHAPTDNLSKPLEIHISASQVIDFYGACGDGLGIADDEGRQQRSGAEALTLGRRAAIAVRCVSPLSPGGLVANSWPDVLKKPSRDAIPCLSVATTF